jgi:uncharacterized alpha-E superfamily protein
MSRYVERAIAMSRLVDVTWHLELDAGTADEGEAAFWVPLVTLGRPRVALTGDPEPPPHDVRHYLSLDLDNPNSLVACVRSARSAAQRAREAISSEMWEELNGLYLSLTGPQLSQEVADDPHAFYRLVRERAQFFLGLADCTMAHDEAWHFVSLGTFLERADSVARFLQVQAHLLNVTEAPQPDAAVRWLAVLRSCGSAEAYARYYSLRVEPARVLEFILLNPVFPQSLRFSLVSARAALAEIAAAAGVAAAAPVTRAMGRLCARLETTAIDEVLEEGLTPFLRDVHRRINEVGEQVTRTYLRDEAPPSRLGGVARAAMILASQQQQQ